MPPTAVADIASAVEEAAAAIGGAIATREVADPLLVLLRHLQRDLLNVLDESGARGEWLDERAVARVVSLGEALNVPTTAAGSGPGGSSIAASWLRLAGAVARRGARSLAAGHGNTSGPTVAATKYLTEVAYLLLVVAGVVEQNSEAELDRLVYTIPCTP